MSRFCYPVNMRTIKNLDYQVTVDLVQLARKHPEGIPHDTARVSLHKHLGARSVTHLVQRLQAEGIVLAPVKVPRVPKGGQAPADAAQPDATPAPSDTPDVSPADAQPDADATPEVQAPAEDPIGEALAQTVEVQDQAGQEPDAEAAPAEGVA